MIALVAAAIAALAGCTLPLVFGFGVSAHSGAPSGTPSASASASDSNGSGVASTAGNGIANLKGQVQLDDRSSAAGARLTLVVGTNPLDLLTDASGKFSFLKIAAGTYTLLVLKAGYTTITRSVTLANADVALPTLVLSSPVTAVSLAPASDSVYPPPEDPTLLPIKPVTVAVAARVKKANGDDVVPPPGTLTWQSSDPTSATVDSSGLVSTMPAAVPERLTITAHVSADPQVGASVPLTIVDPGAVANVRIL